MIRTDSITTLGGTLTVLYAHRRPSTGKNSMCTVSNIAIGGSLLTSIAVNGVGILRIAPVGSQPVKFCAYRRQYSY